MAANCTPIRIQSQVQRLNLDRQAASPSPAPSPWRGTTPTSSHPTVLAQEQPPFGPP